MWLGPPQGPALYCNAAVRACAGTRNPHDHANLEAALVHPDDLAGVQRARNGVLADATNGSIEARLTCPVGGWRWHRLSFSVLKRDQQVDAYLATATDIHDLQQALLLAQESAEQLRLAAASTQLGVYSFDLETRQHTWSAELKAIFGLSADAPVPAEIAECVHPEDRARFETLRRESLAAASSGTFQDEHRIIRQDGSVRWVFVKGRVSFTGEADARKPKGGLGFVLDITERKIAEQALAHSEERCRALVDTANDIVATLDLEGRFTSINPAVRRILGYEPHELIGVPLRQLIPPDELAIHEFMLKRKLEGEIDALRDAGVRQGWSAAPHARSELEADVQHRPAAGWAAFHRTRRQRSQGGGGTPKHPGARTAASHEEFAGRDPINCQQHVAA